MIWFCGHSLSCGRLYVLNVAHEQPANESVIMPGNTFQPEAIDLLALEIGAKFALSYFL